jgi:ABC-2 type transport system permease protein
VRKILSVAVREFVSTVATKGFVIGVLIVPAMIGGLITILPLLINEEAPRVEGEVAVVDPTGRVVEQLRDKLAPEALAARRADATREAVERVSEALGPLGESSAAMSNEAIERALGEVPRLGIVQLGDEADLEREKAPLREGTAQSGGRLALLVVDENAIERPGDGESFGAYQLFVKEKLDDRVIDEIERATRSTIVDERIAAAGLDPQAIDEITSVARVRPKTVTEEGEKETNEVLTVLLPMGFMVLLFVSVLTGGQYLMTTTIEEKSSRVVEILLSAVSPMQLMTGKILGQLGVGLSILLIYSAMGIAALVSFALLGMLELSLLFYLVIFFLIAYFTVASLMAAIGSAVNELREAQSLMTPVTLTLIIPWLLWMPISRDPNSMFSMVTSFIPPINSFVMLLRLTSTTPPPVWQVWLSIAIGAAGVWLALKAAAKIFRIGLLMHGKAPNFATLWRWIRMA